MLQSADIAWVAGIVDALGRFKTRHAGATDLPQVVVQGRYEPAIACLARMTGVTVVQTRRNYSRHNCTDHCPTRHQDIVSVSAKWELIGARATVVLWNVLPYLRLQRAQAEELVALGLSVGFKGRTLDKMEALGWALPPK